MRVWVNADKCHGHARCHTLCPEVFEIGDVDGKSRVKVAAIPEELRERVRLAVDRCPEDALRSDD